MREIGIARTSNTALFLDALSEKRSDGFTVLAHERDLSQNHVFISISAVVYEVS